ncbi:MAG TPA: TetR/AcrR family transcriptional regulator [Clostridiaceae bacterium]|nr:TetR/AcrR family transcriptional regulator [Clostridiaceae bacterium]
MGPKVKFTKEQIIETAFEIARTEGIESISMRKIAEKMGSSVAPIYVNFKNTDELNEALMDKIISISRNLLEEENTGNPFHDIGIASLRFATEYSVIFRDLVIKGSKFMQDYDKKMTLALIEEMQKDSKLTGFSVDELKTILFKMRVFQVGLSVMAASGLLPKDYSIQEMEDILSGTADDVIMSAKLRKEMQ